MNMKTNQNKEGKQKQKKKQLIRRIPSGIVE